MSFISLYVYFIGLSFLVSVVFYRRESPLYIKLFTPFLLLTLFVEVYASYLSTIPKNNFFVYNFFTAFEFGFYLFLIGLMIKSKKVKRLIGVVIALYSIAAVINILFIQGIDVLHTTTYAAGCLLVVAFSIYYFSELFRIPGQGKLLTNPAFWICTGLLFFYCCGFPLYGLINVWSINIQKLVYNSFELISNVLNIFIYTVFTIAFLCNRSRRYISS